MYVQSSDNGMRVHVLALDPGEDVLESIESFLQASGLKNGVVVSGIGTFDFCRLHMVTTTNYPPDEVFPEWRDSPLELVSIQGVIADGRPHLHTTVSDKQSAVAGHLEPGTRVLYLCEIVILEFTGMALRREPNTKGIPTLTNPDLLK